MTLYEDLLAELGRREDLTRQAADCEGRLEPEWTPVVDQDHVEVISERAVVAVCDTRPLDEHIALHDPADALRRYAAARRVLERHRRIGGFEYCAMCSLFADDGSTVLVAAPYPCPDVVDLAASLGIEVSP